MAAVPTTPCAFCPRLCRHVCPVAVATGMEAAVPSNRAYLLEPRADRTLSGRRPWP